MSDVMLYGVLRMPYHMAMESDLSRSQFYSRAQEALDRLEKAEAARRPVRELTDDDIAAIWNESCDKYHHPRCVVEFARALPSKATGEGKS